MGELLSAANALRYLYSISQHPAVLRRPAAVCENLEEKIAKDDVHDDISVGHI